MWANAQCDGRPAEHRWRPLFNAAKFGWRPLLECRGVSSAHVHCCQTAGWIKTALGTEVGLGPGHIVLDGDPAPLLKKGAESLSPIFGPFLL